MLKELHCFEGYTKAPEPASSPLLWKNFPCYGSFLPQIFPEKRLGFWLSDTPQRNLPPWSVLVFFLHWSAFSFSPLGFLFSGLRLGPNTHRPLTLLFPTVCQPCQDGWKRFKSNCYLFDQSSYSYRWKTWEGSRDKCKEELADLVVIESLEEQARPVSPGFFRDRPKLTKHLNVILFENMATYCCSSLFLLCFLFCWITKLISVVSQVGIHQ